MPENNKLSIEQMHKQRICSQVEHGEKARVSSVGGASPNRDDFVGVVSTCFKYLCETHACVELRESLASDSEAYRSAEDSAKGALSTQAHYALVLAHSNLLPLTEAAFSDLMACLAQVKKLSKEEQMDEFGFYFRYCKLKELRASNFSNLKAVFDKVMLFEYADAEALYHNFCWNLCRFFESK